MMNLKLGLQGRLKVIKLGLHRNYKYAEFLRYLPVGGSGGSLADQGRRHEHEVAVAHASFIWVML